MSHALVAKRSGSLLHLQMEVLGIYHIYHSEALTFADMEVACHLVTGPVYLAGETITCRVSVVNNAPVSKVFWYLVVDIL